MSIYKGWAFNYQQRLKASGSDMLYQVSNVSLSCDGSTKALEEIQVCTMSSSMGKTALQHLLVGGRGKIARDNVLVGCCKKM